MKKNRRTVLLIGLALVLLALAALAAIERSPLSPETKRRARQIIITGTGLALAVALGAVALVNLPWGVAAAAAGIVLVATGAYNLMSHFLGLPQLPAGRDGPGPTAPVECPPGYVLDESGTYCLGIG